MGNADHHLIGQQLGTCVLQQLIGAGGMGMVYLAQQTRPTRNVAVKVLRSGAGMQSTEHQEFLARFRREANVIAQLDHVNILPIYEYGEEQGVAYLVMPYLTGGSLRTLLAEHGTLSPREALPYIEQAASALHYAHSHKIVHRDIKPANMLFHADGRLVLVDFGIARIIKDEAEVGDESITATGNFLGSVDYMAPEMVQGMPVDHRADIYELGIVLFQMLTGRVPFQGGTTFIVAAMHIHEKPPSLSTLNASLPAAIDNVVQKALAKNPDDRYISALEFAAAFRRAVSPSYALFPDADNPFQSSLHPELVSGDASFAQASLMTPDIHETPETQTYDTVETETAHSERQQRTLDKTMISGSASGTHSFHVTGRGQTSFHGRQYEDDTDRVNPSSARTSGSGQNNNPGSLSGRSVYAPAPRRRHGGFWLILLCFVLIVGLGAGSYILRPQLLNQLVVLIRPHPTLVTPQPTIVPAPTVKPTVAPQPSPTLAPDQQALTMLHTYYDDINRQDYQDAYNIWSPGTTYRQTHTYDDFVNGYANTTRVNVMNALITENADGSYHIPVTLYAYENGSAQPAIYTGYYDMGEVNGNWMIVGALIHSSSSS